MRHLNLSFERMEVLGTSIFFHFKLKNEEACNSRVLNFHFELWQTTDMNFSNQRRVCELRLDPHRTVSENYSRFRALLGPVEETPLILYWTPSIDDLQEIEDHRKGETPIFCLKPLLLVDAVWPTEGPPQQWRREFGWAGPNCGNGWPLWMKMPDSDWLRILQSLQFKHHVLDRIKWPALPPVFRRSGEHLADGWERHRLGDPEGALMSCYKAFECLGFNLYGDDDLKRSEVLKLLMEGSEPEKSDVVMHIMQQLQKFFHLGRHEKGSPVKLTYADSQMALVCATTVLSYLGPYYKKRQIY